MIFSRTFLIGKSENGVGARPYDGRLSEGQGWSKRKHENWSSSDHEIKKEMSQNDPVILRVRAPIFYISAFS